MKIISKEEFFETILDGKTPSDLMTSDSKNLHYLQIIFFKPWMAKISVTIYFGIGLLVIILLNPWWLKLIIGLIILYTDYKNRNFLNIYKDNTCLYEVFHK